MFTVSWPILLYRCFINLNGKVFVHSSSPGHRGKAARNSKIIVIIERVQMWTTVIDLYILAVISENLIALTIQTAK